MAQDNRNRNPGDDRQGNRPDDQVNREGRSAERPADSESAATPDEAEGEDMDELDEDDDRDLDDRPDAGGNRRRSIG